MPGPSEDIQSQYELCVSSGGQLPGISARGPQQGSHLATWGLSRIKPPPIPLGKVTESKAQCLLLEAVQKPSDG